MLINVHDVHADGSLSPGKLFAKLDPSYGPGAPDGMKCDRHGNVYVTGPGGIWVFAADSAPLGILRLDERAGNLAWGGDDWSDLFVTASTTLYRIPMTTYGMEVLTS
jgi:gluconolactonase